MSTKAPKLIDSHTHLDNEQFEGEVEQILARAKQAGISHLVTIGAGGGGYQSAYNAVALSETYSEVWASIGVHPHDTDMPLDLAPLEELHTKSKVVAIGETGLDYFRDWAPVDKQREWFAAQIAFAKKVKLPLIIHSREAGEECFKTLADANAAEIGGVFHCFAEDDIFAARLREMNFLVSFPGTVTFKKADELRERVKKIPLEQMMVETDAPYMAPTPYRGKRCESAYVVETAKMIAEVKNIAFEELAETTTATAKRFYNI